MGNSKQKQVYISTLGMFDVHVNDQSILHYFGNSKKTLLLFKYFVAHIGEKVYTTKIMDAVFSQYQYQDPNNTLRGHIHRLRGILNKVNEECGAKLLKIEYLADHYIFSVDKSCSVDYAKLLNEIKKKPTIDRGGQRRAEEVKLLYRGDFMPGDDSEWVKPIRVELSKQFGKYITAYLKCYFDEGYDQELVEEVDAVFERLLFEEDVQVMYIQSLMKLGQSKQAMSHVEYLTSRYEAELMTKPSERILQAVRGIADRDSSASVSMDLFEIEKMVRKTEGSTERGAFVCDREFFLELFRLMIRQKARDERYFFIGVASIAASDFRDMPVAEMREAQDKVVNIIASSIRAQDAVSRITDTQVAFMFLDALEGTVENVGERIKERLTELETTSNLIITISYKAIIHENEYLREVTL